MDFVTGRVLRISIHAPRTGSDLKARCFPGVSFQISIHAPRTGSDLVAVLREHCDLISIHAPRTGSDEDALAPGSLVKQFQSTLPARGATL